MIRGVFLFLTRIVERSE